MSQITNTEQYQYYKELLSCLSDGELVSHELEELLVGLQKYPDLNAYWQRLQLKNSVLKKEYQPALKQQWLDNIRNAINTEALPAEILSFSDAATQVTSNKKTSKEKFSAFTNFAIAASVMFVVMAGWLGSEPTLREAALAYFVPQSIEQQGNERIHDSAVAINRNINNNKVLASSGNVSSEASKTVNDLYLSEPRIQDYMLLHAENASLNTNQGLLPFARMSRVTNGSQF